MITKRFLKLEDILIGEKETIQLTNEKIAGFCKHFSTCIDSLLKMLHFIPKNSDTESPKGLFNSYCHTQYLIAPYTCRACYILWERGHYSEATIILRSILESMIQIRYLYQHKEKTNKVWTTGEIGIWTMLKSIGVNRDFYKRFYGRLMSGVSHRKIAADTFRVDRTSPTEGKVVMIPEFDLTFAGYIVNNLTVLMGGYLNFFKSIFPKGYELLEKDPTVFAQYNESVKWINIAKEERGKTFPQGSVYYSEMDKITTLPAIKQIAPKLCPTNTETMVNGAKRN